MEDKTTIALLQRKGVINKHNVFRPNVEFERNPKLDRVSISRPGKKSSTSVCLDSYIAKTMETMLGTRAAYIMWVRKCVDYIQLQSKGQTIQGNASISRLVQREAIAFIKKNAGKRRRGKK